LFKVGKCLLSDRLKKADLTQTELAELTSIPKSQISEYVNNRHVMSLATAKIISHVLKCNIEELYIWMVTDDESC
jgi:plasmid maintenance system antidote protein VapI